MKLIVWTCGVVVPKVVAIEVERERLKREDRRCRNVGVAGTHVYWSSRTTVLNLVALL